MISRDRSELRNQIFEKIQALIQNIHDAFSGNTPFPNIAARAAFYQSMNYRKESFDSQIHDHMLHLNAILKALTKNLHDLSTGGLNGLPDRVRSIIEDQYVAHLQLLIQDMRTYCDAQAYALMADTYPQGRPSDEAENDTEGHKRESGIFGKTLKFTQIRLSRSSERFSLQRSNTRDSLISTISQRQSLLSTAVSPRPQSFASSGDTSGGTWAVIHNSLQPGRHPTNANTITAPPVGLSVATQQFVKAIRHLLANEGTLSVDGSVDGSAYILSVHPSSSSSTAPAETVTYNLSDLLKDPTLHWEQIRLSIKDCDAFKDRLKRFIKTEVDALYRDAIIELKKHPSKIQEQENSLAFENSYSIDTLFDGPSGADNTAEHDSNFWMKMTDAYPDEFGGYASIIELYQKVFVNEELDKESSELFDGYLNQYLTDSERLALFLYSTDPGYQSMNPILRGYNEVSDEPDKKDKFVNALLASVFAESGIHKTPTYTYVGTFTHRNEVKDEHGNNRYVDYLKAKADTNEIFLSNGIYSSSTRYSGFGAGEEAAKIAFCAAPDTKRVPIAQLSAFPAENEMVFSSGVPVKAITLTPTEEYDISVSAISETESYESMNDAQATQNTRFIFNFSREGVFAIVCHGPQKAGETAVDVVDPNTTQFLLKELLKQADSSLIIDEHFTVEQSHLDQIKQHLQEKPEAVKALLKSTLGTAFIKLVEVPRSEYYLQLARQKTAAHNPFYANYYLYLANPHDLTNPAIAYFEGVTVDSLTDPQEKQIAAFVQRQIQNGHLTLEEIALEEAFQLFSQSDHTQEYVLIGNGGSENFEPETPRPLPSEEATTVVTPAPPADDSAKEAKQPSSASWLTDRGLPAIFTGIAGGVLGALIGVGIGIVTGGVGFAALPFLVAKGAAIGAAVGVTSGVVIAKTNNPTKPSFLKSLASTITKSSYLAGAGAIIGGFLMAPLFFIGGPAWGAALGAAAGMAMGSLLDSKLDHDRYQPKAAAKRPPQQQQQQQPDMGSSTNAICAHVGGVPSVQTLSDASPATPGLTPENIPSTPPQSPSLSLPSTTPSERDWNDQPLPPSPQSP